MGSSPASKSLIPELSIVDVQQRALLSLCSLTVAQGNRMCGLNDNWYDSEEWDNAIYKHEGRQARVMINRLISRVTVVLGYFSTTLAGWFFPFILSFNPLSHSHTEKISHGTTWACNSHAHALWSCLKSFHIVQITSCMSWELFISRNYLFLTLQKWCFLQGSYSKNGLFRPRSCTMRR